MMGHHSRSESLFYYFRLEDQAPENHLLPWSSREGALRVWTSKPHYTKEGLRSQEKYRPQIRELNRKEGGALP